MCIRYVIFIIWQRRDGMWNEYIPVPWGCLLYVCSFHQTREMPPHWPRTSEHHQWPQGFLQSFFTIIIWAEVALAVHMPVWPHWWSTSIQVQILPITMSMIAGVYQLLSCCQSTYFMLHYHFQWFYCSVCMLHTGPPLSDVLLAWPQHQGRELCVQHLLNMAWCDGTYF